jgi:ferric-dicitrate binding protein FerR (iron transport regulator)
MAKTKRTTQALLYLRGLADDEYVQEQVRNALDGLAHVSRRIARKRGKAAEDKRLYDNLRQAATSVRNASRALQRRKPEPKRRGRKVIAAVVVGGGIAVLISQKDWLKSTFGDNGASETGSGPDAYPHPDGAPVPGQPTGAMPSASTQPRPSHHAEDQGSA